MTTTTTTVDMDFTDAYPVTRAQHAYSYSPGATFLATVQHLADDGRDQQFGRVTRQRPFASSMATALAHHSSSDGADTRNATRSLVHIRVSATLQVVRSWTLAFSVTSVRWSQNGTKLLCAAKDRLVVLIVDPHTAATSLTRLDVGAKGVYFFDDDDAAADCVLAFKAGAEGMSSSCWIGGDTVCTMSGDGVFATLHDTATGEATVVSSTKTASRCHISPSQEYVAFLQRKEAADVVSIMARDFQSGREAWRSLYEFNTHSNDAVGLTWSPDERYVAVWDGVLEYKLLIFSVLGHLQASVAVEAMHPTTTLPSLAAAPSAPLSLSAGGLGIRDVRWSPNGRFIAVGDYHDQLRLLETKEWCECASFDMAKAASAGAQRKTEGGTSGWREPVGWQQATGGRSIVRFEPMDLPVSLPVLKPDLEKRNPNSGVCWMEWNADGERLAVRSESVPNAVFVLAVSADCDGITRTPHVASVLVLSAPVSQTAWRPRPTRATAFHHDDKDELAIVCQSSAVYFWRVLAATGQQTVEAIPIPIDNFAATHLAFAPDGRTLTLASTTASFCCAMDAVESDRRVDATCEAGLATPSHL